MAKTDTMGTNEFEVMSDKAAQGIGLAFGVSVAELLLQSLLSVNSSFMSDSEFETFTALKVSLRVAIEEMK